MKRTLLCASAAVALSVSSFGLSAALAADDQSSKAAHTERMDAMAGHMARRAAEFKTIAESAKPFYGSLDDTQKRKFGLLGSEMLMAAGGPVWEEEGGDAGGTWVPGHWME